MEPHALQCMVPDTAQTDTAFRLAAVEWGTPGAMPVLCVHGLTRNGRDFDWLAQRLCGQYRVLCPDMPGRGKSEWLPDAAGYSYPTYVSHLAYFIKSFNISRLHWIGTSMGGILGMMLANAFPGLIQSLTLNDIGCTISAEGLRRIVSYAGSPSSYPTRALAEGALRERVLPFGIHGDAQWRQFFEHSIEALPDGRWRIACDPAIGASLPKIDDITDIDLWQLWPAVTKIPVLLLRGEQSDILTKETAQAMQARHPDLTYYEVANTGHAPALMDKDQIDLIQDWIGRRG